MKPDILQFQPGDIIQKYEEPFLKCLNVSFENKHCFCCFKQVNTLQRCGGCKMVFYCNKNCQKTDWNTAHSIECKLYGNTQASITKSDAIWQIIRLMSFLKLHGESAKKCHQRYNGSSRCFNDLIDNSDGLQSDPTVENMCTALASILDTTTLFSTIETSYKNIIHLLGVWRTNAFGVSNEENTKIIGSALYVLSSSYDHACRPNALRVMDSKFRMEVRCIEPIPVGISPNITYLSGIRERGQRQEILKKRYYFLCECALCEAEKEGTFINYEELFLARESLQKEKMYGNEQFDAALKILQIMQKLFYKYDERITNFCDTTLEKLVVALHGRYKFMVTVTKVKEFAEEVEERLRITYGVQHKDYQYYIGELAPRLQKAK